ncbi:MAG: hypothetical protein LC742_08835, partial [Acidobacteria bacterium]|nr:hypothetical protein [Acidobacteriota bacterium]
MNSEPRTWEEVCRRAGGAYAQKMDFIRRRTANLQGPEAQGIARNVGQSAEVFFRAENTLEENLFKSATGRDELIQFFKDPGAAARNFTDTLAASLQSGAAAVTQGAQSVAGAVVETVKQALGINSPSTVAIEQGKLYAQGLVIGLSDPSNVAAVRGAVGALIDPIINHGRTVPLSRTQRRSLSNLNRLNEREPEFLPKLISGSRERGINPDHLLNVIAVETGGSFSPQARNPNSSASGLIQFMRDTARSLGTTIEAIRGMNATQQLDYVFKYFDQRHLQGKLGTQGGVYAAVGAGRASRDDDAVLFRKGRDGDSYRLNAATWDRNSDGLIRQGELAAAAISK